jgi:hypothetical protein
MLVAVTPGAVLPPLLPLPLLAAVLVLLLPPPLELALLLLLLPDDPQAATASAAATITPTYASDLVPGKLIPLLLLHTVGPTGTARLSRRAESN